MVDPPASNVFTFVTPWATMLIRALGTPNATVFVDKSVDLDLSAFTPPDQNGHPVPVRIAAGVQLIGGRTAIPGKPYEAGPRLFTTTRPSPLFSVDGPGVRISGLRIQGHLSIDPPEIASDDSDSSVGISISPNSRGAVPIEIDHNEIYGWSNAGVEVKGQDNQPQAIDVHYVDSLHALVYAPTPEPAYIHDNFFHNNLHTSKLGYGVVVGGNGAHALIERNVFDWNRHSIAGDGADFSGYRAYRNLVLPHGGNDIWISGGWLLPLNPLLGVALLIADSGVWQFTHQFDMHGQSSYCRDAFLDADCGTAGHDIDIQFNSFLYTNGTAIKVRGTPQLGYPTTPGVPAYGAVIKSNVFAHASLGPSRGDAVDWTENGVFLGDDLQTGVTPYVIDSCDFDGDHITDTFMTTGQTWWYSSGGKGPWTYLNASTSSLQHGDISLGDVDGDGLCDVVAGGVMYSGGTTIPKRLTPRPIPPKARALGQ
jgi:hypothetical protein